MELIILFVAVIGVLAYFLWKDAKHDASGTHPLDGATKSSESSAEAAAPQPATTSVLDVNKDGKVDIADAVEVVKKVKTKAKTAAKKVADKTKKVAAKKPAKPAPAKKSAPAKKPKK